MSLSLNAKKVFASSENRKKTCNWLVHAEFLLGILYVVLSQHTWSALTWSDLGECAVALVEMLTSMRKRVTNSAIRPGTIEGGTKKLT